jgi:hypothetical protein
MVRAYVPSGSSVDFCPKCQSLIVGDSYALVAASPVDVGGWSRGGSKCFAFAPACQVSSACSDEWIPSENLRINNYTLSSIKPALYLCHILYSSQIIRQGLQIYLM